MLLRDDRQVAIGAVETLCFETADSYASAAESIEAAPLARVFARLAEERRQLAIDLAAHIRMLDDLPKQPDPDREVLGQILIGIKALLSGDAQATFINERADAEDRLVVATQEALRHALPAATQSMLHRIREHAESAKRELNAAKEG